MSKPRGYFKYLLGIDFETSGLFFGSNPVDDGSGNYYQPVSAGIVVIDADTLTAVEQHYIEIQWDGNSLWSDKAQKVHGLTKQYLQENGVTLSEAVELIGNIIVKYWGPTGVIHCLGHNVHRFDVMFLDWLMKTEGIHLRFGNRHIDTCSAGFLTFGTYNSDDLFDAAGMPARNPNKHNALDDILCTLESARTIKTLWKHLVEPAI